MGTERGDGVTAAISSTNGQLGSRIVTRTAPSSLIAEHQLESLPPAQVIWRSRATMGLMGGNQGSTQ
jgi:hypothetical protein